MSHALRNPHCALRNPHWAALGWPGLAWLGLAASLGLAWLRLAASLHFTLTSLTRRKSADLGEVFGKLDNCTRYTDNLENAWLYTVVFMKLGMGSLEKLKDVTYVLLPDGIEQYYEKNRVQRLDNIIHNVINMFSGQLR